MRARKSTRCLCSQTSRTCSASTRTRALSQASGALVSRAPSGASGGGGSRRLRRGSCSRRADASSPAAFRSAHQGPQERSRAEQAWRRSRRQRQVRSRRSWAAARSLWTCICSVARAVVAEPRYTRQAGGAARSGRAGRSVSAAAPDRRRQNATPTRWPAGTPAAPRRDARARRVALTAGGEVLFGAHAANAEAAAYGIERMRFALGVDDDLRPFLRRFAGDPLIGDSLRRRPWLRAGRRPEPFEALVLAISEQLIEYERAAAIQRRLRCGAGTPLVGLRWDWR